MAFKGSAAQVRRTAGVKGLYVKDGEMPLVAGAPSSVREKVA